MFFALRKTWWFFLPGLFLIALVACFQIDKPYLALFPCMLIIFHILAGHFGLIKTITMLSIITGLLYYFDFIPSVLTLFPTEMLIVGGFLLFPVSICDDYRFFLKSIRFKKSLFLIVFSMVISLFFIINKSDLPVGFALYGDSKILIFILGYIMVYYVLYYKYLTLKSVFICITIAGFLFIIGILILYVKNGDFAITLSERLGESIGVRSTIIGMLLDMIFPVSFFLGLHYKSNPLLRIIFLGSSLVILVILLLTYVRGSFFGLIALALYFMFRKIKAYKLILLIVVLAFFGSYFVNGFQNRFEKQDKMGIMLSDYIRYELLQAAFRNIKANHVIFGDGMLTYSMMKYTYDFPIYLDEEKILSTHSYYLEHFVGMGLFGFLGIIIFLWGSLYSLIKLKVGDEDKYLRLGLIFSLISCLLHGFVDSQVGNISFSLLLFSILASSAFLCNKYKSSSFLLNSVPKDYGKRIHSAANKTVS